MGNVYTLDGGRSLILYESGNTVYLRTAAGEGMTRPAALCTDYAGSLSDTVCNGTVYYCYVNTDRDIVIRSITDLQELFKIDGREMPDCLSPCLVCLENTLLLFYAVRNPVNDTYSLKVLCPFQSGRHILLPEGSFEGCPDISALHSGNRLLVYAGDGAARQVLCFHDDLQYSVLEDTEKSLQAEQAFSACEAQLAEREERLSECETKLAEREAQLEERGVRLSEREAQLAEQDIQLAERDRVIDHIRAQYEELMDTALKYREEAAKWHEIACRREARPIPGEKLLEDNW